MDLKGFDTFIHALEAKAREVELPTAFVEKGNEVQLGDTLRILLPIDDAGNVCLMEVMMTPYEDDVDLVHLYTTMLQNVSAGNAALREAIAEWNLLSPLGSYGIFTQGAQLYHKYTFPSPIAIDPAALAEQTMTVIELIYDILDTQYPEAARLNAP